MVTDKIKIAELIKYPFQNAPGEVCLWELELIIEHLKLETYQIEQGKFDPTLFQVKVIYNNPHDSDENSYRYLLFFKEAFTCLFGYTGDRGYDTVMFASVEQKKALRDYFLSLYEDEDEDGGDILPEEIVLSDSYTTFFKRNDSGEYYYFINSPRWSYCFNDRVKNLFHILDDEITFEKINFVRFLTNKRSWGEKPEDKFIVATREDGTTINVAYNKLIFKV